ncbi:MAG: TRAP transporter large permease subunit [Ignavibacteriales bacterium]|nr:MAG: TRAP transporter large permease subunit [Ignavibacteriaceae bacterium]MBW7873142.1 TRAP transporter large permease subunit [Ignavibacteria bacterium]MCZ2142784.1 TRAP transporter large permease subunit [Ignavibacteriales bacterium]OQY75391.1 MAG: C4-dicarboxylate ABC transporter [Ignavibacteriales bacterium UTCHB3]MBV6443878.1 C4-dicarboxylate TRAP transporter large permease protein DctM [Ignavibacteriaceae bacterium]
MPDILIDLMPFIFFAVVVISLLMGFPVAFTLGGVAVLFGTLMLGPEFLSLLPLRIWGVMSNFVLIAVPMFVFMGVMFERSGIAEELLETMALIFGKIRGGLAIGVLLVGALLGASTGIVGATVVTMGVISLPVMLKRGCAKEDSTGVIAASGTLGQIIPPSIILILLGSVMNIPVGDLFMSAVIPGLILVGLYLIWVLLLNFIKPSAFPPMSDEEIAAFKKERLKRLFTAFFLPSVLIILVLGSIFMGVASPTEAAGVGALGAMGLAALRKKLNFQTISEVSKKTVTITTMALMILIGATAFSLVFRELEGDVVLTNLIMSSEISPWIFLLIVMLIIFMLGFLIDFIEIIFIVVPIVDPIFRHFGMDMLWIAILIAMNLQTSFLTPPFGFSLFYLKGVSPPEIKTTDIYKGVVPYIIIQVVALLIVVFVPALVRVL